MKRVLDNLAFSLSLYFWLEVAKACLRNGLYENPAEEEAAKEATCRARPWCSAQLTASVRSPIHRRYTFVVAASKVEVTCIRQFILFGAYVCKESSGALPAPVSASATTLGRKR